MRARHGTPTGQRWPTRVAAFGAALLCTVPLRCALAGDGFDLTVPASSMPDTPAIAATADTRVNESGIAAYLADWEARVARVRASQPHWSSPLVTTTGLLEQRLRFDLAEQHAGNGANTTVLDGGRGVDLIVSETNEVQIGAIPYYIRSGVAGTGPKNKGAIEPIEGFNDWPFLRVEQRLASAPAGAGNYVLTAWVAVQAPAGTAQLTNEAWVWQPTLAFGKGWGDFDVQGTVGGYIPASRADIIGYQIVTNVAFQYHIAPVLWPEVEVNWTHYMNGQRDGLNQVYLTGGLVIGRFRLPHGLGLTVGGGYQSAVAPAYQAKPLTPSYNHAWLFTTRLNF